MNQGPSIRGREIQSKVSITFPDKPHIFSQVFQVSHYRNTDLLSRIESRRRGETKQAQEWCMVVKKMTGSGNWEFF